MFASDAVVPPPAPTRDDRRPSGRVGRCIFRFVSAEYPDLVAHIRTDTTRYPVSPGPSPSPDRPGPGCLTVNDIRAGGLSCEWQETADNDMPGMRAAVSVLTRQERECLDRPGERVEVEIGSQMCPSG